jgi:hypothetical protein
MYDLLEMIWKEESCSHFPGWHWWYPKRDSNQTPCEFLSEASPSQPITSALSVLGLFIVRYAYTDEFSAKLSGLSAYRRPYSRAQTVTKIPLSISTWQCDAGSAQCGRILCKGYLPQVIVSFPSYLMRATCIAHHILLCCIAAMFGDGNSRSVSPGPWCKSRTKQHKLSLSMIHNHKSSKLNTLIWWPCFYVHKTAHLQLISIFKQHW